MGLIIFMIDALNGQRRAVHRLAEQEIQATGRSTSLSCVVSAFSFSACRITTTSFHSQHHHEQAIARGSALLCPVWPSIFLSDLLEQLGGRFAGYVYPWLKGIYL